MLRGYKTLLRLRNFWWISGIILVLRSKMGYSSVTITVHKEQLISLPWSLIGQAKVTSSRCPQHGRQPPFTFAITYFLF